MLGKENRKRRNRGAKEKRREISPTPKIQHIPRNIITPTSNIDSMLDNILKEALLSENINSMLSKEVEIQRSNVFMTNKNEKVDLLEVTEQEFKEKDKKLFMGKNKNLIKKVIQEIKSKKGIYNVDYKSKLAEIAQRKELTTKNFFHLLKIGVEDILGIRINNRILSADYLTKKNLKVNKGNKWYVNNRILESLKFTDYALPTSSLNQMEKNLIEVFKEKGVYFDYLIDLYKSVSSWDPKFSKQSDIIFDFFKNINTLEKAYWLGFLLAEGTVKIRGNSKMFSMTIGALDLEHLINFCKAIGFDYRKLRYERIIGKYGQTLREFSISFTNNEFCESLIENCFPKNGQTSDNPDLRFPYWIFSDKKFTMAMLLGFFDGDGSHHLKFPNLRQKGEHGLYPSIRVKNEKVLDDIKDYFKIENEVEKNEDGSFELTLNRAFFNDLLINYDRSLKRKRYDYPMKDMINKKKMDISKMLLAKGWSLEEIYSREFGYSYKPNVDRKTKKRLIDHFQEWFAKDPAVKDNDGTVSLRKIVEIYGKIKNNPLVISQKEIVILKRREGWSLEKIYTKELGYKYDFSNYNLRYTMVRKFREIFKDDPLIIGYEDVLKRIEEVYNPTNKL